MKRFLAGLMLAGTVLPGAGVGHGSGRTRQRSSGWSSCPAAAPRPGTNFDNGVKLAVKEINAAGGILGRKIEYTAIDTQSQPSVAKALAQKAVDAGRVRGDGPGVLGLDHRQHGRDQARRDPELHRRRGGEHHAAGQSVHLPHVVHAGDGDAEGRASTSRTPSRRRSVGGDVGQQRLRQGRPRRDRQGARSAGHQGRRRHLDRPGPGRLLGRGAEGQASRTPTRCSSTPTRKSRRARCASCRSRATTSRSSARRRSPARR